MSSLHPTDYIDEEFTSKGELEEILTGTCKSGEAQPLLLSNHQQNIFTVVPRPSLLFGMYNKINYTSACYNVCWLANNEQSLRTKSLLCFGGGFSRVGSILSFLLSLVLFLLPFASTWPFFFNIKCCYTELLIFTACMEFLLFLWHFHCIYVIKVRILETWFNSWFTFCVETEILQDVESSTKAHSFFCLRRKLQVIDVSVSDLYRLNSALHQITATEREKLAAVVENHRLEQAVIILYTKTFINEFLTCSMFCIFVLAALSAASTAVLVWKTLVTML